MAKDANKMGGTARERDCSACCEGKERKRLTSKLTTVPFEQPDEVSTSLERTTRLADGMSQILNYELVHCDMGRPPATAIDTAIQPTESTVGSARGGDVG